jgi:hypothetical protein
MLSVFVGLAFLCVAVYGDDFPHECPIGSYKLSKAASFDDKSGEIVVYEMDGMCCSKFFFLHTGVYCSQSCVPYYSQLAFRFENGNNQWQIVLNSEGYVNRFGWYSPSQSCADSSFSAFMLPPDTDDTITLDRYNKCTNKRLASCES